MIKIKLANFDGISEALSPVDVRREVYTKLNWENILKQEDKVLLEIYRLGKAISSELCKITGISSSSMARSLFHLRKKNLIIFAGIKTSSISRKPNSIYQVTYLGKLRIGIIANGGYNATNSVV